MSGLLTRICEPLRRAAVTVFRRELVLVKVDGDDSEGARKGGIRIVLQERGAAAGTPRPRTRAQLDAERERIELSLMREQLARLLDEQPETRPTLRHLVFVEHALLKKGLRALHKLPLDVLQRALDQLEGMVTNWSPTGLASLRSRMAVAIIDREHMDPEAEADAYRTSAVLDASLLAPASPPAAGATPVDADADDEDAALAAAYAAMGHAPPSELEVLPELQSPSARAMAQRSRPRSAVDIELDLRELQP